MPRGPRTRTAPDGLLIVDKPAGLTSHDVVARVRRLAGTRKVGHAGTLDPMATGVLILGIERGTRLLGHLAVTDKTYTATIRLGVATVSDDADGTVTARVDAAGVDEPGVAAAVADLTGEIQQRPSDVSAIKVDGRRAHALVRAGEAVDLAARTVQVGAFVVQASRRGEQDGLGVLDLDVTVDCSTGTYVRALARDLGAALGVGGHLTALRRTRVGPYDLGSAHTLAALEEHYEQVPLDEAVATAFGRWDVARDDAVRVRHGARLPWPVDTFAEGTSAAGPLGVFGPDGTVLSLVEQRAGQAAPLVVFSGD